MCSSQSQLHKRIAERLNFSKVSEGYRTLRKIRTDTTRIHKGKISSLCAIIEISSTHSVSNQVAKRSFFGVSIFTSNSSVCCTHWLGQFRMLLKVCINQRHTFRIWCYTVVVGVRHFSGFALHITCFRINDQLNIFKCHAVRVRLYNQLAVYCSVCQPMIITSNDNVNRGIRRKRFGQISCFTCSYSAFSSRWVMCKHNDRLYAFRLELLSIFLNSRHFLLRGEEIYASCAGR
ncbi:hypothetical protein D3C76_640240 [compost metagenome]